MSIRVIPPEKPGPSFPEILRSMRTGEWQEMMNDAMKKNPKYPPLELLPCANVDVDKYFACEKPGKLTCNSCKLVSYCSKQCQKAHSNSHKSKCNDPVKSGDWKPAWIVERRNPRFLLSTNMSAAEELASRFQDPLSVGMSLWGNVPAMDVVNLQNNEKDPKTNLSLAFAASGDIRNVVATVNGLGSDYSGQMNILINDFNPCIISRNIILLLILGTIPDEVIAADIALHFWYSVFMPAEYRLRILSMVSDLLRENDSTGPVIAALGPLSTLTCHVTDDFRAFLMHSVAPTMSLEQAQLEYERVREAPSRVDFRDRMYMGLKPSHRLAFLEYRRFGIILPFGAVNMHFNSPNPSLFADGAWLQTDYADPLASWDLDKVFAAGKAHGAQSADVYGCLYFFLSDQLRAFARHIRQHRIAFHVFSSEACVLARDIAQGKFSVHGFPCTTRFDRIDVSNIMDLNYVGIRDVVNAWGPLLANTDNAALTGYFMNWAAQVANGRAVDAGIVALGNAFDLMKSKKRHNPHMDPRLATYIAANDLDAFYDNSKAFSEFWNVHSDSSARLRLRTDHKIFPHRLGTAIGAKPDALPEFSEDERWYRYTRLVGGTWAERFVELVHAIDGNESVHAINGNELVHAIDGNELVHAIDGNELVHAIDGNELVHAIDGNELVHAIDGNELVHGIDGNELADGTAGNDASLFGKKWLILVPVIAFIYNYFW